MQGLLEHFVELLEHLVEKPGDLLTGAATLLLVWVTYLLFKATKELGEATKVLAQSAREDSRNRKIQATADAWMELRLELDLPKVTPAAIDTAVRRQLIRLEAFSRCINSGVFDLETFNKISGTWFLQQFERIKPLIERRQKDNPNAWKEFADLARASAKNSVERPH